MIRVLVVDDSPTMRAILSGLINSEPDLTVIGTAADALEAREAIRRFDPDVVTLDINMPGMSGLEFLDRLMRLRPTPVVVVSGLTKDGAEATARALELGAVECYEKPDGRMGDMLTTDEGHLAELIRAAAKSRPHSRNQFDDARPIDSRRGAMPRLIAIGSSTGGIDALHTLLSRFPADCPPTLVVQHINGHFAEAVASRLNEKCAPIVTTAQPDLPLQSGHIYLAPGNERHLQVRGGQTLTSRLAPGDLVSGHRPSVDMLFHSVAECCGREAVGILLTGMGSDGAHGLLAIARAGGFTIAQDEATCTVFGMPRSAIELGAAQVVAPISRIANHALARAA